MKLLKLTNDYVFKRVFGEADDTEIVAGFLSDVLGLAQEEFDEIAVENPIIPGDSIDLKTSILDLRLKMKSGEMINVEMQVARDVSLVERLLCQAGKLITSQIPKGIHGYQQLKRTIVIAILNNNHFNDSSAYHKIYRLYDQKNHSTMTDLLEFHMLELNKVPQEGDNQPVYDWCKAFIFSREEDVEALEQLKSEAPKLEKALGKLKVLSRDTQAQEAYDNRERAIKQFESNLIAERILGKAEGIAEGIMKTAKKLLEIGLSVEQVVEGTGLSVPEVEKIQAEIKLK